MMRSMFSGVSGLRVHQSRMDVVAHNIANVNTTAFSASRMTFAEAFSQTMQAASAPQPAFGRGGTNPRQIGLGVNMSNISRMISQGAAQRTDDPFHLMIEGDGFFVVGDNTGTFFTRAGDFFLDEFLQMTMPNGMLLQGWQAEQTPEGIPGDINQGPVSGITIQPWMQSTPPVATSEIRMEGNLRPGSTVVTTTKTIRDSQGNAWTMMVEFRPVEEEVTPATTPPTFRIVPNEWEMTLGGPDGVMIRQDGARFYFTDPLDPAGPPIDGFSVPIPVEFDANGRMTGPHWIELDMTDANTRLYAETGAVFGQSGKQEGTRIPLGDGAYALEVGGAANNIIFEAGVLTDYVIRIDMRNIEQFGERASSVTTRDMNGLAPGTLTGLSISQDGMLVGQYSNGQMMNLWQVVLANFANPAGLASLGNNVFSQTANSGLFDGIGIEPGAMGSDIMAGTLEMSNVDLAGEFTDMIVTQRGFQANSRVITTSDEMLQELVNLRR